jgi:positive phototaxis protein PixI
MTTLTAPNTTCNFLSFPIDEKLWAILPTVEVAEIVPISLEQIIPVPATHPAVMGAYSWRGEVLWVVDLQAHLRSQRLIDRPMLRQQYSLIVVKQPEGFVGLMVEQVGRMYWIDTAIAIQPTAADLTIALNPSAVLGYWQSPETETTATIAPTYIWLNLPSLLKNI